MNIFYFFFLPSRSHRFEGVSTFCSGKTCLPITGSSWTALAMSVFSLPSSRSRLFLPLAPDKGSGSNRPLFLFPVRKPNLVKYQTRMLVCCLEARQEYWCTRDSLFWIPETCHRLQDHSLLVQFPFLMLFVQSLHHRSQVTWESNMNLNRQY